jgi:hypothetical protein
MGTSDLSTLLERVVPEDHSTEYVSLIYALVLLWGLGDVFSTYFAYAATGTNLGETNPWMEILLAYNPVLVAVVKGAVVLYVGIILLEYRDIVQTVPGWRLWLSAMVVLGILVVVNNLSVGIYALA